MASVAFNPEWLRYIYKKINPQKQSLIDCSTYISSLCKTKGRAIKINWYMYVFCHSPKLEQKFTCFFVFKFWNDVIMQLYILSCVNTEGPPLTGFSHCRSHNHVFWLMYAQVDFFLCQQGTPYSPTNAKFCIMQFFSSPKIRVRQGPSVRYNVVIDSKSI